MTGQYLHFIADNAVGVSNNYESGFYISSISAFGSENLVTRATFSTTRALRDSSPSFDTLMTQLAPRSSVLAPGVVPTNCAGYSGSSDAPLTFQLDKPTYIDDLHVVGDGYDGAFTADDAGTESWTDICDSDVASSGASN